MEHRRRLPPLNALRAFEAAARHLNFSRAADELSVTPGAVSQQIQNLEDYVGVALFKRTPKGLLLTDPAQIALPALVSTLAICIVFVPMFLLAGIAKFLFVPLAEAVVFAMLASYIISRTLVPTLAMYLLGPEHEHTRNPNRTGAARRAPGWLSRAQAAFERGLIEIQKRGFADDSREFEQTLACCAAAVFDHRSVPVAAISVSGPADRILAKFDRVGAEVAVAARAISERLGYIYNTAKASRN